MSNNENSMAGFEELIKPLQGRQDWITMSAADRTYAACEILQNAGFQLPSWTVIRSLIGKGSGNDINNAKKRFLKDHADRRKKMNGIPEDLPKQLIPVFKTLWMESVTCALDSIKTEEALLRAQIESLEDELAKSDETIANLQLARAEIESKLELSEKDVANYHTQLEAERATRKSIEQTYQQAVADAKAQHDLLMDSLRSAREELDKAAQRMEAQEERALRMIDEIKTESGKRIQSVESKASADRAEHQVQLRRLDGQLKEAKAELATATEENSTLKISNATLSREVVFLNEQLTKAQELNESLSSRRPRRFGNSIMKNMKENKNDE